MSKYNTIAIYDTSYYLKKTFEFIQQYQVAENGYIFETLIYLKLNLLEGQTVGNDEDRVSASNTVIGSIAYVGETYVIILARLSETDIYSEYTINYSSIIEISNTTIPVNYNLYKRYMSNLPELCESKEGKYFELYENLKLQIIEYKKNTNYVIKLIFNEVASRVIEFEGIDIVKNLIIVDKSFIIPLTFINGFIITPKAISEEKLNEGGK